VIYFAQTNDNAHIKIGYASNVRNRLNALQTGAPSGVKLLASMPGNHKIERQLHDHFGWLRVHGEWFRTHKELTEFALRGSMLTGIADNDPFLPYVILEPRLIEVFVRAASVVDDGSAPYFCANETFFGYGDARASIKHAIVELVGWSAPWSSHSDLKTEAAYDTVYERIYEALPDCRDCGCVRLSDYS
jgi:Meiotically Up-regulated Gene 113 (MUG113) protein